MYCPHCRRYHNPTLYNIDIDELILEVLKREKKGVRTRDLFNELVRTGKIQNPNSFFRHLKYLERNAMIEKYHQIDFCKRSNPEKKKESAYYHLKEAA